jgi:predicted flap endonuclease-1-like 5' DNA nuclease
MKVIAAIPFVARVNGLKFRAGTGDVLEMPAGADWVRVGLAIDPSAKPTKKTEPPQDQKSQKPAPVSLKRGLVDVSGIGLRTAEALVAAGVETLADLVAADTDELAAALDGSNVRQVAKWQADAQKLLRAG